MSEANRLTGTQRATGAASEERRMYGELRAQAERMRRRRQQLIERIVQQRRELGLRSFRRPTRSS
jgi:hypothetical protein